MSEQKSIISTLTIKSFKLNKARNLVAILAIILTTLMFTSLFVLSQSMMKNLQEMNFQQAGYNSHLTFDFLTDEEAQKLTIHKAVKQWGKSTVISVAENKELIGRQVEIRYADKNYAESTFSLPTKGRLPENEFEIALDTLTLDKMGLPYELGQNITLIWRKDLSNTEYITSHFILVGYWKGNAVALASMAWVSEAFIQKECANINQEEQRKNKHYFRLNMLHVNVNGSNLEYIKEQILEDSGLTEVSSGANIAYDTTTNQNIIKEVVPIFICIILVFVSGFLIIYNIFQISVTTDIRFYGKLKTLGTSKKQLKRIIYSQANYLSLIGIPIGLLLGYILGTILVPMMIINAINTKLVFVNLYVFISSALFAYLTVLISCMKPAKIAGKVSPMEALHYIDTEINNKQKVKVNKRTNGASIYKMALANLGRNKKRTIIVICSLTLGLVLLTALYAKNASFDIDKYMEQVVISDFEVKDSSIATKLEKYNPYGTTISSELISRIKSLDGLEDIGYLYSQVFTHKIGRSALENIQNYYNANNRLLYIKDTDSELAKAYYNMIDSGECTSILYGIDGLVLNTFLEDYRILDGTVDIEKFQSGNYVLVEAASGAEEVAKEIQPTYNVGDIVDLNGIQHEVMGIITNISTVTEGINSSEADFISFYLPTSTFKAIYPQNTIRKIFFNVVEEFQLQAEQMLIEYQNNIDKNMTFTSKSTLMKHYQNQIKANTIIGLAISIIIAFVGILNFINSMVTAIVSRRKEFAMIQSIGMTKGQLRIMLINEGLYYVGITLIISYSLGSLIVIIGVRAMVANNWTATFHFTLTPLIICTPILIIFAILIPYLCFRNLEKQSIVERLRID